VRQSTVASNIANANTPGFAALDVQPFEAVLEQTQLTLAASEPGHLQSASANPAGAEVEPETPWEVYHSGNSVSLEQELIKAGQVTGAFQLDTGVVKAFHRMLLMSSKG
jgi:flagellar basal-body rod protein FlgB